jgi:hypothetical protein
MSFEEFVLAEGCFANGALVGEVRGLQRLLMILGNVIQQFPLVDLYRRVKLFIESLRYNNA